MGQDRTDILLSLAKPKHLQRNQTKESQEINESGEKINENLTKANEIKWTSKISATTFTEKVTQAQTVGDSNTTSEAPFVKTEPSIELARSTTLLSQSTVKNSTIDSFE